MMARQFIQKLSYDFVVYKDKRLYLLFGCIGMKIKYRIPVSKLYDWPLNKKIEKNIIFVGLFVLVIIACYSNVPVHCLDLFQNVPKL